MSKDGQTVDTQAWTPDSRWLLPVIFAVWSFAVGWLPAWSARAGGGFPPWLMGFAGVVVALVGIWRARHAWPVHTHGEALREQGSLLAVIVGVGVGAWLVVAGYSSPWAQLPLLLLFAAIGAALFAALATAAPRHRATEIERAARVVTQVAADDMRELLDASDCADVKLFSNAETRAGYTLTLGPDPSFPRRPNLSNVEQRLPDLTTNLAIYWRDRDGTELTEGDVRLEALAADRWYLHVSTKHVLRENIPFRLNREPTSFNLPLWLGLFEDGAAMRFTLCRAGVKVVGATGGGKALDLLTPIPTPDGWTTMGALRDGDRVFSNTGAVCTVVAAHAVQHGRPCYDVEFSDGSTIIADADHLWWTETRANRMSRARAGKFRTRQVRIDGTAVGRLHAFAKTTTHVTQAEFVTAVESATDGGYTGYKMVQTVARTVGRSHVKKAPHMRGGQVRYRNVDVFRTADLVGGLIDVVAAPTRDQTHLRTAGGVRTTTEIRNTLKVESWSNHSVPVAGALDLPGAPLPIPPYTLGAWLGDGTHRSGGISSADPEVYANIAADGYQLSLDLADPNRDGPCQMRTAYGLSTQLRALGLLYTYTAPDARVCEHCGQVYAHTGHGQRWCTTCVPNQTARVRMRKLHPDRPPIAARVMAERPTKHIPAVYLRGSIAQRRALLAGLLDTDGTVSPGGGVQFTSTSAALAEGTLELALSLGYRAVMRHRPAKLNGETYGTAHTVVFSTTDPVFRLARKLDALRERTGNHNPDRNVHRYIVAVRAVESRPVRCITVDSPSHLYLAGRTMIPTHNTVIINNLIARVLECRDTAGNADALVWVAASEKLVPLVYPWLLPWLNRHTAHPAIDMVVGEDPNDVGEFLRRLYFLAKDRNQRLSRKSKHEASAALPGIVVFVEEAKVLTGLATVVHMGGEEWWSISRLLSEIAALERSAAISLVLITQVGLFDGLGSYGDELQRHLTIRACTVTMTASDGYSTLPALPATVDTTMLRDHSMYLQVGISEESRAMPGKAADLDEERVPVVAQAVSSALAHLSGRDLVAFGEDYYAHRWDADRVPVIVAAAADDDEAPNGQGYTWPVLPSQGVVTPPAAPPPPVSADPPTSEQGDDPVDTTPEPRDDVNIEWAPEWDAELRDLLGDTSGGVVPEGEIDPNGPYGFAIEHIARMEQLARQLEREADEAEARPYDDPPPVILPEPLGAVIAYLDNIDAPPWVPTAELASIVLGDDVPNAAVKLGRALARLTGGVLRSTEPRDLPGGGRGRGYVTADLYRAAVAHRDGTATPE